MTLAIAEQDERTALALPQTTAVLSLVDYAAEVEVAYTIAQKLCASQLVPKHFQGKPADGAVAILTGKELGITPIAALRSIFIINNTPGMYAKVMVAVAQSRGHRVWVAEQSDDRVVVKGTRRGEPEVYETVWTPERVKLAGLESNPKYKTSRQQMMVARGQAEIARQVAADALHGIPYSVEELEDMPPIQATATVRRVSVRDIPVAEPAAVETEPVDIGDAPTVPQATPEQWSYILDLIRRACGGRATQKVVNEYLSPMLGRDVSGPKDLTQDEVESVVSKLVDLTNIAEPESATEEPPLWPETATVQP